MINLIAEGDQLVIQVDEGDLKPRYANQFAFWGFEYDSAGNRFSAHRGDDITLVQKVTSYLEKSGCSYLVNAELESVLERIKSAETALIIARDAGMKLKDGAVDMLKVQEFIDYLKKNLPRRLKEHQIKAALHLLAVQNGANFSVPGSGKTTVVLAVFHQLRYFGDVDSLFVVGPPACFGPWRTEYKETLGKSPTYEILAGGNVDDRRTKYLVNPNSVCDLYLTTFQTLQRDWEKVRILFEKQGVKFYFIVDEAHYIKQLDGAWANAVLNVARHAVRRTILTGTPYPQSYADAFNLFDVLWPERSPISNKNRQKVQYLTQKNRLPEAAEILKEAVGPLFYRVRKPDLGLAPQIFHPPIQVKMNSYERLVYDSILDKIRELSQSDYIRNLDLLMRLRRGRMIRLRQCVSYSALLRSAITEYTENLLEGDLALSDVIMHYDELETPGKIETLLPILRDLLDRGEKVVIWSNFVRTLELLCERTNSPDHQSKLIYGATPIQSANVNDEMTREEIIQQFLRPDSGVDVLVANPAACAESISLHKSCSYAIYYDLSYNSAQYLQSLDRIHRVGGSEDKSANYTFLHYENSIDDDILSNVRTKAENMSQIIDLDYAIYSLDMFEEDEELGAYERIFDR